MNGCHQLTQQLVCLSFLSFFILSFFILSFFCLSFYSSFISFIHSFFLLFILSFFFFSYHPPIHPATFLFVYFFLSLSLLLSFTFSLYFTLNITFTYSLCPKQKASMLYELGKQLTRIFSSLSAVTIYWSSLDIDYWNHKQHKNIQI